MAAVILPCIPDACEGEEIAARQLKDIGLFWRPALLWPLIECVYGDKAAPLSHWLAPDARCRNCLRASVDGRQSLDLPQIPCIDRNKAPSG